MAATRAIGVRHRARCLCALGGLLIIAGCGSPSTPPPSPTPTLPSATPSSEAPGSTPVVAVLDHPFGSVGNTVRLVSLDGVELAHASIPDGVEALAVAGRRVLLAGGGRISALDTAGRLGPVETIDPARDDVLIDGLIADPTGHSWLWAAVRNRGDGSIESQLIVGGEALTPRVMVDRVEASRVVRPLRWSDAGPLVSDEDTGIGGYALFRRGFGDTSRLDLDGRALAPVSPASCALSDLRADGSLACVSGGHEAPPGTGPVALHLRTPSGSRELPIPGAGQAGTAYFSPDGKTVSLGWSPATGAQSEPVGTELVDVASGGRRPLASQGLIPQGWTSSGVLVAARPAGVGGGERGTFAVHPDGAVTRVSSDSDVVGIGG